MGKLGKKLETWVEQQFITPEQGQKISAYESNVSSSKTFYGFLLLGAFVIGVGVIAIVTANWHIIPDYLKLLGGLLVLSAVAIFAYIAWERQKDLLFDFALFLMMMLSFAVLGLISQVYNINSGTYQELLAFSAMTAGVAWGSKRIFIPLFWMFFLFQGIFVAVKDYPVLVDFFNNALFIPSAIASLVCFTLYFISQKRTADSAKARALRLGSFILFIISLGNLELLKEDLTASFYWGTRPLLLFYASWIVLTAIVANEKSFTKLQKLFALSALVSFALYLWFPYFLITNDFIYAITTCFILGLVALLMSSLKQHIGFQVFIVLIGLRVSAFYFEHAYGMIATGVLLVATGVLLLLIMWLYQINRQQIERWFEGIQR